MTIFHLSIFRYVFQIRWNKDSCYSCKKLESPRVIARLGRFGFHFERW